MGEQPIFSTKAHVFQIDPNTKKKWLPVSAQAINVAYYHDSTRNTYRIISVDGSKAVINSTIMPNMTFTKTSQKFGQWSDPRANTVYGLGFSSEADLAKFIEKFKEVKELTRLVAAQQQQGEALPASGSPSQTNGTDSGVSNHIIKLEQQQNSSPVNSPRPGSVSNTPVPNSAPVTPAPNTPDIVSVERQNSSSSSPSVPSNQQGSQVVEQLKYENDRLKIALAQSSANAKKWEVELQTLKNNNARLTTALQESTSNVDQWKKQLASYKEESARLKKKVVDMDKGGGGSELLQRQLTDSRNKVTELEKTIQEKQEEIIGLKGQVDSGKTLQDQNKKLQETIKTLEQERDGFNAKLAEQKQKVDTITLAQNRERQQLHSVHQQLANKLSEVYELNDKFAELTQS